MLKQNIEYKLAWWALFVSALVILAIGRFTNIDLMIEDYYYDETLRNFPWKSTWFANDFMHGYLKNVIVRFGYLLIAIIVLDTIFHWEKINPLSRIRLRFVALASVLIPSAIRGLQQFWPLHCPWNIDRYGGTAPFLKLFDAAPKGMSAGHCFPAGHATVGLWLAALCVFWLPSKPKTALAVFLQALA